MTPRSGSPVRGSRSGRPVMALLDLLGRRWTLRLLWELRGGQLRSFNELQRACEQISPSVLSQRLAELREAGLVARADDGRYAESALARQLGPTLLELDGFARRWARRAPRAASGRPAPRAASGRPAPRARAESGR